MGITTFLVQRGGACSAQSLSRCTKCNSPHINGQCCVPITVSLCGFNVAIKGLKALYSSRPLTDGDNISFNGVTQIIFRFRFLVTWLSPNDRTAPSNHIWRKFFIHFLLWYVTTMCLSCNVSEILPISRVRLL